MTLVIGDSYAHAAGKDLCSRAEVGVVYALDPDKKGEIVWQTRVGKAARSRRAVGMATDGQNVYAAASDASFYNTAVKRCWIRSRARLTRCGGGRKQGVVCGSEALSGECDGAVRHSRRR